MSRGHWAAGGCTSLFCSFPPGEVSRSALDYKTSTLSPLLLFQLPLCFSRYVLRICEKLTAPETQGDSSEQWDFYSVCVCVELHLQLKSTEVPSEPRSLPPWTANPQINCRWVGPFFFFLYVLIFKLTSSRLTHGIHRNRWEISQKAAALV